MVGMKGSRFIDTGGGEVRMKCKHCGFDTQEESIRLMGAPCGYNGCMTFLCCMDAYKEHMNEYHRIIVMVNNRE